jgi:hypothetical protein
MAEDRLTDIREQTKDIDETEVRRLYSEYEKTLTQKSASCRSELKIRRRR